MKKDLHVGIISILFTAIAITTIATICFVLTYAPAFAAEKDAAAIAAAAEGRTVNTFVVGFYEKSSTSAYASVRAASSSAMPESLTCTIVLQSAPIGSNNFTTVSGSKVTKTVYDTGSIMLTKTYAISSSKDYRIKIQLTDVIDGVKTTVTDYKDLDR